MSVPVPSSTSVKLVLLGESAVGKSSLALRFCRHEFLSYRESTIGAAFLTQSITEEKTGSLIKFELWDTAGQERYSSLAPMYYRNAQAAIVVYDLTSTTSLLKARKWISELQRQADPSIIILLVGNKLDLAETQRQVDQSEVKKLAQEEGLEWVECSAKSGQGVNEIFQMIANKIPLTSSTNKSRGGSITPGGGGGGKGNIDLLKNATGTGNGDACAC